MQIFEWRSWNHFSGKVRQSVQSYLNQSLMIGTFLKNVFEATLSSKTNVLSVWKELFSAFCKFLSDEVETVFWKREAKRSRLFKWKFGLRNFLRKWFWRNLELINESSERLKRVFSVVCKFLSDKMETMFWESQAKRSKLFT